MDKKWSIFWRPLSITGFRPLNWLYTLLSRQPIDRRTSPLFYSLAIPEISWSCVLEYSTEAQRT